jgi:hypothetical protein
MNTLVVGTLQGLFLFLIITLPKLSANATAASLPLGNIRAYKSSSTVKESPTCNWAEVPGINAASYETLHLKVL